MSNEWNGGEDDEEGSENYVERLCYGTVEWFGLRSKIHDLEIANDESKTKLETGAASAKKAQEKSKAEATVELQKVKNQLQTEVASKTSLEESLAKYQKLKQLLATKIFQTNPSNEDLIALLNLEIEELFERYDQILRFNKSDRFKVKEEVECTVKDKKLDLQILQRELYEKELDGIMDVLQMPSGDRNYTNILPMIKGLLQQVDTDH
jgi:DNA primase